MSRHPSALNVDDPVYRASPMQQMLASCSGAVLTSLTMTPLDVVKIRLQAQQRARLHQKSFLFCNGLMDHLCVCANGNGAVAAECLAAQHRPHRGSNGAWYRRPCPGPAPYSGASDAALRIVRAEGVLSLWSGLLPTLVSAIPATLLYFTTYDQLRMRLNTALGATDGRQPALVPLLAGAAARVWASTAVAPLELVRTRMQASRMRGGELGDAVRLLVREQGVRGLWKGLTPTLIRDVPFSAIYWCTYEWLKRTFGQRTPGAPFSFAAGACAGSLAAVVTLPFDVVKTHWQIEFGQRMARPNGPPPGVPAALRAIYRESGVSGLFVGLAPRLVKVAPACAIMITSYELGKVFFLKHNMRTAAEMNMVDGCTVI